MFSDDEIYTVSNFLSLCNKTIDDNIPTCWLQGEVSNFSAPYSGHWYFSLKDKTAQIRCAMFKLNQRNVNFKPENGMEILVHAAPTIYAQRGDFQIIVRRIEPLGAGNLQLAFEQLKTKLRLEGLFSDEHKKPIPKTPKTIGVVSSANGAVIKDIIKVLDKRYPFTTIVLFDSPVQGDSAPQKLVNALKAADQNNCDVIIIARGGGSLEDLWAFNSEILARAIYTAKTPIISAIGHQTDTTIADFVADLHAPTPSAGAMLATPDKLQLLSDANNLYTRMLSAINKTLTNKQQLLQQLRLRLPTQSRELNILTQQLDNASGYLIKQMQNTITLNNTKLSTIFATLKQHSPSANIKHKQEINSLAQRNLNKQIKQIIADNSNIVNSFKARLNLAIKNIDNTNAAKLARIAGGLNHLSPLKTLTRGYSITSSADNKLISTTIHAKIDDSITTKLTDGTLHSKIYAIKKN